MRTRKEIEDETDRHRPHATLNTREIVKRLELILEVLLDIRDLTPRSSINTEGETKE